MRVPGRPPQPQATVRPHPLRRAAPTMKNEHPLVVRPCAGVRQVRRAPGRGR